MNCVAVSGITHTTKDEEILDILKQYGKFKPLIIDDVDSPFYKNLIIEFKSTSAIAELKKMLPYTHVSESDPNIEFCVRLIESAVQVGAEAPPPNYVSELRNIARRSGIKFETVLQEVMTQISEHLDGVEK